MNSKFPFSPPKRFGRCALGTLLLALPLSGIGFSLSPVQAQPTPIRTKPTFKPLPTEVKATVDRFYAMLHQEQVCSMPLDFVVKDASLDDIIAKAKAVLPPETVIEVRESRPMSLTLDLRNTSVGNVLQATAGFMGSKLWVFNDRLVIAPQNKLSKVEEEAVNMQEGGDWARAAASGGQGWGSSYLHSQTLKAVGARIQESIGNINPTTGEINKNMVAAQINFTDFSPELQRVLQRLVDGTRNGTRLRHPGLPDLILGSDATIKMNPTQDGTTSITLRISGSQPAGGGIMWNVN